MAGKIIIIKVPRTDPKEDNSSYEAKVPYEVEDDYGNKVTLYRREPIPGLTVLEGIEAGLLKQLAEVQEKIAEIKKLG